jgi:bacterioferritin-associated ferredoxin
MRVSPFVALRVSCKAGGVCLDANDTHSVGRASLYVCNCNGIREREVRAAIDAGATRPAEVFRHKGCQAQCAKCVCEMRQMIQDSQESLAFAAE